MEFHIRTAFATQLADQPSTMYLPSLGGLGISQFLGGYDAVVNGTGMWFARAGTGTNLSMALVGGEFGLPFLRFLTEFGRSWGFGDETDRIGIGGVLAIPDGVMGYLARVMPVSAPAANTVGLYLGGTKDGFSGRFQLAGML
ncbi:MAG: hypothetical protein IT373_18660, partial [Polyangiaceae bacterium]|nr:hypothetical protein [Polyangiaceae bacterium]